MLCQTILNFVPVVHAGVSDSPNLKNVPVALVGGGAVAWRGGRVLKRVRPACAAPRQPETWCADASPVPASLR